MDDIGRRQRLSVWTFVGLLFPMFCLAVLLGRVPGAEPTAGGQDSRARADFYGDPLPSGAVARMGTIRFHHPEGVRALAFSPDQKALVSAGDHVIVVWDRATGKPLRRFRIEPLDIRAVTVGKAGKVLVLAGTDAPVWPGTPRDRADTAARLIDAETGKEICRFYGHSAEVLCGAFAPDGKLVATGSAEVCLWDRVTGKEIRRCRGNAEGTGGVAFSPDGSVLACSFHTFADPIRLWDVRTVQELRRIDGPGRLAQCVAFSPDGKTLASAGGPEGIQLYEMKSGKRLRSFGGESWGIHALAFAPGGKLLAAGSDSGRIAFWDVEAGKETGPPDAHGDAVLSVAWSMDGQSVFTAGTDPDVRKWSAATGRPLCRFGFGGPLKFPPVFALEGKLCAVAKPRDGVHVWDTERRKQRRHIVISDCADGPIAISPDGTLLAAHSYDGKVGRLALWDLATGKKNKGLQEWEVSPISATFSPDGKLLALGFLGGATALWDVGSGKIVATLAKDSAGGWRFATPLQFSPGGKYLLVGDTFDPPGLWELATRKEVKDLFKSSRQSDAAVLPALCFSPDGKMVAGSLRGYDVILWSVADGRERCRFKGHSGRIFGIAFSPDGRKLVSASEDTTALIWDVPESCRSTAPGGELSGKELDALWRDLAGGDATRAHRALWQMAGAPRSSVPFLRKHLRAAVPVDERVGRRLVGELDSERFATREAAARELEGLGEAAVPLLRRAREQTLSLEARRRVEGLLAKWERTGSELPASALRVRRGVEVLEYAATEEAREVLRALSRGDDEAQVTREAKAALERLGRLGVR